MLKVEPVLLVPNTAPTNVESAVMITLKLLGAEAKLLSRLLVHVHEDIAPAHSHISVCVLPACVVGKPTHRLLDGSMIIDNCEEVVPVVLTDVSDIVHVTEQPDEKVPYRQRKVLPVTRA